jgi:LysM repeat protein
MNVNLPNHNSRKDIMNRLIFTLIIFFLFPYKILNSTTVYPDKKKCPVCQKDFIKYFIGSYFDSGRTDRDLGDSLYREIITCPYCLYSSSDVDFDDIDEISRKNLLQNLPTLQIKLESEEKIVFSKIEKSEIDIRLIKILFARECNKLRQGNKKINMTLMFRLYFISKQKALKNLQAFYRNKCITQLTILLDEKYYGGKEEASLTYLLGEFNRQEGHNKLALEYFKKAAELSERQYDANNWIKRWSFEQSCRINYPNVPLNELSEILKATDVKIEDSKDDFELPFSKRFALEILSHNEDPLAWAIIRDFVILDKCRLKELSQIVKLTKEKLQIDKKLWQWAKEQYKESLNQLKITDNKNDSVNKIIVENFEELLDDKVLAKINLEKQLMALITAPKESVLFEYQVQPDDDLFKISDKTGVSTNRIFELNPHLKGKKITLDSKIELVGSINCSELYVEKFIQEQILLKNKAAIQYALKLLNITNYNRYSAIGILKVLQKQKDIWEIPKKENFISGKSQEFIYDCLSYIKGEKESEQKLLTYIYKDTDGNSDIAIQCFSMLNSNLARSKVFDILKIGKIYLGWEISNYLIRFSTEKDIPEFLNLIPIKDDNTPLKKTNEIFSFRFYVEEIITSIKLGKYLKQSLKEE